MALLAFLLALAFAQPALAASPAPAGAAPSVGELEQLVGTLQDDKARAALERREDPDSRAVAQLMRGREAAS